MYPGKVFELGTTLDNYSSKVHFYLNYVKLFFSKCGYSDNSTKNTVYAILAVPVLYCRFSLSIGIINRVIRVQHSDWREYFN